MYEWAWLIGSIRENYFHEMLVAVEGQSAKYLRLENIALYGIANAIATDIPTCMPYEGRLR